MTEGRIISAAVFNRSPTFKFTFNKEDHSILVGEIGETNVANMQWWNIWTLTLRWPFLRHVKCFLIGDN